MFLPVESHGQRSLVDFSPWGRKELDKTEHHSLTPSYFENTVLISVHSSYRNYFFLMPQVGCVVFLFGRISCKFHNVFSYCSVQFSPSVVSDSLRPHKLQRTRPHCPSPTPRVHSDSCPSSQ